MKQKKDKEAKKQTVEVPPPIGFKGWWRILSLAIFPLADAFTRMGLEGVGVLFLLLGALIFYEILDYFRKTRDWKRFFGTIGAFLLAFGVLMLAISLHASWAHASPLPWKILLTLPRFLGSYYLIQLLLISHRHPKVTPLPPK